MLMATEGPGASIAPLDAWGGSGGWGQSRDTDVHDANGTEV